MRHNSVPHEALWMSTSHAYNFLFRKLIVCVLNARAGGKRGKYSMIELFSRCFMICVTYSFALFN